MAKSSNTPSAAVDIERLLADYPPDIAELVQRLRQAIRSTIPEAAERIYLGWRGVGFHHPTVGYLCAIFPREDHVRVGFEHGHLLHDPDHILEGTGKQVRYLRVSEWDDHILVVLDDLIDQAIALQ